MLQDTVMKDEQPSEIEKELQLTPVNKPSSVVLDSGLQAWLQVLGSFFLFFNTWALGLLSSYGSFQSYYETDLLKSASSFQISTIGSLQSFLMVFLGFLAGPIYDAGYSRHLLVSGSALIVIGTVCQSFCSQFWQLLLAQGACIGVGCGCLAILAVAIPSLWFKKRLLLANGIAASGSGVGGVILPIIVRNSLPKVGFGWTVRIIALVELILLGLAILVTRVPHSFKQRRQLIDTRSFTDWPYVMSVAACFFVYLGMYSPFFYVESFAVKLRLVSESSAPYLVTAMNTASIFGRIFPGLLSQRLGALNMIIATTAILALTPLGFLGTKSIVSIYLVASIYGFFNGSYFSLLPTILVQSTSDMRIMGTRFGMAFTVWSVGLLFGSPITGALQDAHGYNVSWIWVTAVIFTGAVTFSAMVLYT